MLKCPTSKARTQPRAGHFEHWALNGRSCRIIHHASSRLCSCWPPGVFALPSTDGAVARGRSAATARHRRRRSDARRLPAAVRQALAQRVPHAARSGHGVRERAVSVSGHRDVRRSRHDRHRGAAAHARHGQQHVVAAEGARAHRLLLRSGHDRHHLRPPGPPRQQRDAPAGTDAGRRTARAEARRTRRRRCR